MKKILERTSIKVCRALSLERKKKYVFTLSWITHMLIMYYRTKLITDRRIQGRIKNERIGRNSCVSYY